MIIFLVSALDMECSCLLELAKKDGSDGTCDLCLGWGWEEYHLFPSKILHFQSHKILTVLHRRGGVMLLLPFHCCICSCLYMSVYYMPLFVCLYTMFLCHLYVVWPEFIFNKDLFCPIKIDYSINGEIKQENSSFVLEEVVDF